MKDTGSNSSDPLAPAGSACLKSRMSRVRIPHEFLMCLDKGINSDTEQLAVKQRAETTRLRVRIPLRWCLERETILWVRQESRKNLSLAPQAAVPDVSRAPADCVRRVRLRPCRAQVSAGGCGRQEAGVQKKEISRFPFAEQSQRHACANAVGEAETYDRTQSECQRQVD